VVETTAFLGCDDTNVANNNQTCSATKHSSGATKHTSGAIKHSGGTTNHTSGATKHTSVVLKQLRGNRAVFATRSESKRHKCAPKPLSELRFSIGRWRLCRDGEKRCCCRYCEHLRYANPANCCGR